MLTKFQSHIGAIRIQFSDFFVVFVIEFQSHIGAIRIYCLLKEKTMTIWFQSHIGAIRMPQPAVLLTRESINFNPTLVQLECKV